MTEQELKELDKLVERLAENLKPRLKESVDLHKNYDFLLVGATPLTEDERWDNLVKCLLIPLLPIIRETIGEIDIPEGSYIGSYLSTFISGYNCCKSYIQSIFEVK